MTVPSSTASKTSLTVTSAADGVQYKTAYTVYDATHVNVYLDSVLQSTSNYTATIVASTPHVKVAQIVFDSGITEVDDIVLLIRDAPYSQDLDFINNSIFDIETLERGLDQLTMQTQQLDTKTDGTIKFAETLTDDFSGDTEFTTITSTAADRANKYLSFNSSGKLVIATEITGTTITETSVAVGDVLTHDGSKWGNSKILARLSQINDSNGNEVIKFVTTGSAVNEITVTNAATGDAPTIAATGEVDKGIDFENSEAEELLKLASVASAVNEVTITNAATTNAPEISATGGDANIDVDIAPKGTGELNVDGKIKSINGQSFAQSAFHGALILGI